MGSLYSALESLSRTRDTEVLDGFQRYEALLATILTPEQIDAYATYLQQVDVIRIFDEMTPGELAALPPGISAIAAAILADTNISMENRRVVALLHQHGDDEVTPDFQSPPVGGVQR